VADTLRNRSFRKLSLDSKLAISVSGALLVLGVLVYLVIELASPATLGPLTFGEKVMVSLLQSATPRSAGLSVLDMSGLSGAVLFFTMFLMLVGGTSGSVTGGIKVTTFGVLVMTAVNLVRGRENIEVFGRQLSKQTVYRAITFLVAYFGAIGIFVLVMSLTEVFPIDWIFFEVFSAVGTVGLSTGITPDLSAAGRVMIIAAMFIGRLGPLSLMALLDHRKQPAVISYPQETVRLG